MNFESYAAGARRRLVRFATVITNDVHLAQDIVQEVLLRAAQRWDRIGSLDHPDAYVRRMIVNEAKSGWRRNAKLESRAEVGVDRAVPDHSATYERRDDLHRRLLQLPPRQRAAVVMRYLEDLSDDEIAVVLGCSTSTVRVHIHRALTRMRVDLSANPPLAPMIVTF
jgi:RNA polymerase sigma-70 factor (sigma-E family)